MARALPNKSVPPELAGGFGRTPYRSLTSVTAAELLSMLLVL